MTRRIPSQACSGNANISKKTVIASFQEGSTTREFLETLDDDKWQITSFNPEDRLICFDVTSDVGIIHHMMVVMPILSLSWMK